MSSKKLAFKLLSINFFCCAQAVKREKKTRERAERKSLGIGCEKCWVSKMEMTWRPRRYQASSQAVRDDKANKRRKSGECRRTKLTFFIDEGHQTRQGFASARCSPLFFLVLQSDAGLTNRLFAFLCNWYQFTRQRERRGKWRRQERYPLISRYPCLFGDLWVESCLLLIMEKEDLQALEKYWFASQYFIEECLWRKFSSEVRSNDEKFINWDWLRAKIFVNTEGVSTSKASLKFFPPRSISINLIDWVEIERSTKCFKARWNVTFTTHCLKAFATYIFHQTNHSDSTSNSFGGRKAQKLSS